MVGDPWAELKARAEGVRDSIESRLDVHDRADLVEAPEDRGLFSLALFPYAKELRRPPQDLARDAAALQVPAPFEQDKAIIGQVVYVDAFGNLITSITEEMVRQRWEALDRLHVTCDGRDVGLLAGTYDFVEPSQPLALFNSMGLVEIAVNRGRASEVLNGKVGTEVRLAER